MQAAFQSHVDNAITKTVNLPATASAKDVGDVYKMAWVLGSKGITVYRDNSRSNQAIEFTAQAEAFETADAFCTFCQ